MQMAVVEHGLRSLMKPVLSLRKKRTYDSIIADFSAIAPWAMFALATVLFAAQLLAHFIELNRTVVTLAVRFMLVITMTLLASNGQSRRARGVAVQKISTDSVTKPVDKAGTRALSA
jgi:hypothetical protein